MNPRPAAACALALAILVAALAVGAPASAWARDADALREARRLAAAARWAASESLATTILPDLERDPDTDSLALADALWLVGDARWRRVGYVDSLGIRAAARCLSIRTRALGPDHLDVAEAHGLVATYLQGTGQADSALSHARRLVDIRAARLSPDDTLVADAWDRLALIHRDRRDFRAAIEAWSSAIGVSERAQGTDHPETAILIAQTAPCWMELGDLERARGAAERSLGILARSAPRHPRRWIPLNLLATVEWRSGNPTRAADLFDEALDVVRAHQGDASRPALTLKSNLANVLSELGDLPGAATIFAAVHPAYEAQYGPTHPRTLTIRLALGFMAAGTRDTASALAHFEAIERALEDGSRPAPSILTQARCRRAALLCARGRHAEARSLCERAIRAEQSALGAASPLYYCYLPLTWALAALGDTVALDSTARSLEALAADEGEDPWRRANAHGAVTWVSERRGRDEDAWRHILEAERIAREQQRVQVQTLPDRRALTFDRRFTNYLGTVVRLASGGAPERRATAWDRLVRSRGMVREEIASRRLDPGLAADTALAGPHRRWVDAQHRLAREQVKGSPSDSASRGTLATLRAAADEAEAARARALRRRGASVPPAESGLADVRARLGTSHALVSLLEVAASADTSRVMGFVARGGIDSIGSIVFEHTSALQEAVDAWLACLATPPGPDAGAEARAERECRRLGRTVRTMTWDRIAPHIEGAADVHLVADGPLLDLPWGALPDGERGYLVDAMPRLHVRNIERELVAPPPARTDERLLAVGAPDFERRLREPVAALAVMRSTRGPCADGRLPPLAPLPASGTEAEDAARAWASAGRRALVLTGASASEAELKRAAPGSVVIHLATHGVVLSDTCGGAEPGTRGVGAVTPPGRQTPRAARRTPPREESPWMARRVWLALAGANRALDEARDENEGLLTAEEVVAMDLAGTEWVVLSACHSGVADPWPREGMLGMRRAFHLAGARTVIASRWAVKDQATREWMRALYAARAAGTGTAGALAAASRAVLAERRRAGRSTHPFYWAAFTATGG
jgi:CHAT domain-containing protein/tetratricopeptide (TPR) repeat protein